MELSATSDQQPYERMGNPDILLGLLVWGLRVELCLAYLITY